MGLPFLKLVLMCGVDHSLVPLGTASLADTSNSDTQAVQNLLVHSLQRKVNECAGINIGGVCRGIKLEAEIQEHVVDVPVNSFSVNSAANFPGTTFIVPVNLRKRGAVYLVRGERKKWDGNRFGRCCTKCDKLAQGNTLLCKNHGGGKRCRIEHCAKASRGSSMLCSVHGGGKRCIITECRKEVAGKLFCRMHQKARADSKVQSCKQKLPAYFSLLY